MVVELPFGQRGRELELPAHPAVRRDGRKKGVKILNADDIEHRGDILIGVGQVAHYATPLRCSRYRSAVRSRSQAAGSSGLTRIIHPSP